MTARSKHSKAAPSASVTQVTTTPIQPAEARVFDLTGTSISMIERTTHDDYTGPLAELMSVGLIREDQLPPPGITKISWLHGKRLGRGRTSTDETYVRVWLGPKIASVGLGVPESIQQQRRRAHKADSDARSESWRSQWREEERAAQAVAYEKAIQSLADVPKTKDAYLRREARSARALLLVIARIAGEGSECHGYRVSSDSMEEIHARIDAVVEAFLDAPSRA